MATAGRGPKNDNEEQVEREPDEDDHVDNDWSVAREGGGGGLSVG
jgi:hypothetical protein